MPNHLLIRSNNQCASRLPVHCTCRNGKWKHGVEKRLQTFAASDRAASTIDSLDGLLGSRDGEEQAANATQQEQAPPVQLLRVPGWAWSELREPRVVPTASNVLYYLVLIVYTSYYVVQLAQGQEVADDLLARLVNDHTQVASGDTLRLFTSFFVADSLSQLIIALVGLATVVAELESLLGYSTFWAVWCITVLAGCLADAAFSDLPITAGPAAGVGGAAAALLAHHLHNWRVEQLLAQLKAGEVPEPLMQLEHQYNTWQQQQLQLRQAQQAEESGAAQSAVAYNRSSSSSPTQQYHHDDDVLHQRQHNSAVLSAHDSDTLLETEIEGPIGMQLNLMLPREGKAFAALGGAGVAVVSALKDAADSDAATDMAGLVAAFLVGAALGWLTCPMYAFKLQPASSSRLARDAAAEAVAGSQPAEQAEPDLLLPVLYDSRAPASRANAVVGAAAALFAALGVWLTTQGLFV